MGPAGLVLCFPTCPWMVVFESVSFRHPWPHLSCHAQRKQLTEISCKFTPCWLRYLEGLGRGVRHFDRLLITVVIDQTRSNNEKQDIYHHVTAQV